MMNKRNWGISILHPRVHAPPLFPEANLGQTVARFLVRLEGCMIALGGCTVKGGA